MKCHFTLIIMLSGITNALWGQDPQGEIGGFEYSVIPDIGDTQIEKYAANLNFGTKLGKGMVGLGISYTLYDFLYKKDSFIDFNLASYERIHNIRFRMFYRYMINESWSGNIMFSPVISSNLEGSLSNNDLIINSILSVSKKWGNDKTFSIVTFGLGFGTPFGEPQFFPAISFRKKINSNWSYILGIPETSINYTYRERHTFSGKASFSGLFGNASSSVTLADSSLQTNTKLQYNSLNTGIQYNYRIQPNWTTTISLGYAPWNQLKIRDNDNNELYDIESNSSFYISMGLKFNLNKTKNENKK
ncbi:DUF6268 family outer membrane beta-barrel protein [Aquimarina sp. AD1]|uniref:DUF6268 family outer membrane beta-barrel protein n=1 Tax=Aquimarina sp. (strain AD1) TaxID=1714848 RepID=UPI000ED4EECB|nr:DUF6268 family outer membrane beta-barrel protein [Aquimarina sp. AD1]RKN37259.1 hypothetical protein D7035_00975 [Aquimarina sp. AD1]